MAASKLPLPSRQLDLPKYISAVSWTARKFMPTFTETASLEQSGAAEYEQVEKPCDPSISCCSEELIDHTSDACSSREYQPENDIPELVKNMLRAWEKAHWDVNSMQGSQNKLSMRQVSPIEEGPDRLLPPQRFIKSSKRAHVG